MAETTSIEAVSTENSAQSARLTESADTRQRIRAIVGASSGNLVEWFDFYIYSFCALYFAPLFFPSDNPTTQLVQTAGVFAAGFLMRPIGVGYLGILRINMAVNSPC